MTRHCLLLDLKDDADLIAAYRAWHAPGRVPGAVIASIRRRGIADMQIWNAGDRLVMITEYGAGIDPNARSAIDASDPHVLAWEKLMDDFQRRLEFAHGDVKWVPAEQVFDLADHDR